LKVLISLLFITFTANILADEMRYYDIEVVVLENLRSGAKLAENWPEGASINPEEKTVQLGQPVLSEWLPKNVESAASYKVLRSKTYQLTPHVEKLSKSKKHRVLYHTAWRQPGLSAELALPIYFKRDIPAIPVQTVGDSNETSISENLDVEDMGQVLEGILRVTLARYLHFEAELILRNKVADIGSEDNPFAVLDTDNDSELKPQVIYLNQKRRRIRSKELHYLDHPVLGIMVKITPYLKNDDVANKKR